MPTFTSLTETVCWRGGKKKKKEGNTVTPHSAPLGGRRGGDRDKVQRVIEISCKAQSTTTSSQLQVKQPHNQLGNCLIFPAATLSAPVQHHKSLSHVLHAYGCRVNDDCMTTRFKQPVRLCSKKNLTSC